MDIMPGPPPDNFIELGRTFHELSQSAENDEAELRSLFNAGKKLGWTELLDHHRVVLLSEAGSGKTFEIREATRRLACAKKPAFFLRLEYLVDGLEHSFEEGSHQDFLAWLQSSEDGWLLLDSVDEARLRNPADFERGIRVLGRELQSATQRVHLVITGRSTAWRPKTDLSLCNRYLPYVSPLVVATKSEGHSDRRLDLRAGSAGNDENFPYKVVAFDSLTPRQIEIFARAKGLVDTKPFMDAVERADAWSFTSRPQDLENLVEYWKQNGRLGGRFEIIESGIQRRLDERDQRRAEAQPISTKRIRHGICAAAAACTLAQKQTIRVPDGAATTAIGLPIKEILPDWDDADCAILLMRPVFDDAIYGTVRFHHRSVREFLTAEWFSRLLRQNTSRRRIEELFFREQYGVEVVIPSLRPVLPWLAIMDRRIAERVRKLAPEVFFEGGDPAKLPLDLRRSILKQVCEQIAGGASSRSMMGYDAVQRFASVELTEDIVALLNKYAGNSDVSWFLLRMIWQGQLKGALHCAKQVALRPAAERYARMAAFRAVAAVGQSRDTRDVRNAFLLESKTLDREWLAELLKDAAVTSEVIDWLFDCLAKVEKRNRHTVDGLSREIMSFVERADGKLLPIFINRSLPLVRAEPFIDQDHCRVSSGNAWLLAAAGKAAERLILMRSSMAMSSDCLEVLRLLPFAQFFDLQDFPDTKPQLPTIVPAWRELNWALFWHLVEQERRQREAKAERLTDWWNTGIWKSYILFEPTDFDTALACAEERSHPDDKLVALTLAHRLYIDGGRTAVRRRRLHGFADRDPGLSDRLRQLMRPPVSEEMRKHRRMEADWKRRGELRRQKEAAVEARWRKAMNANLDGVRDPQLKNPEDIGNWQYHLHERMRKIAGDNSNARERDWTLLRDDFGEEIARAFREAVVAYWRRHKPKLRSEGAPPNQLKFAEVFGLTGLEIEAREDVTWPAGMTEPEAELAFRYAMHELNGFPSWMPRLYEAYPDLVCRLALSEISYELTLKPDEMESFYLLHDLDWSGTWLWNAIADDVFNAVSAREPNSYGKLHSLLKIVNGSSLPAEKLAQLARRKVRAVKNIDHKSAWFAVWVGVEANVAIPAIRAYLASLPVLQERTDLAMRFISKLCGERARGDLGIRDGYRTPAFLGELYLLMHDYIKRDEDIERAGKGVYSPELRDDAQRARDQLFNFLKEIPGKETFIALESISRAHPDVTARPWFTHHAKTKAEQDAEGAPWTPKQVSDFTVALERTPTNNRDLFDLAYMRLSDLKDDLEGGDSSVADTWRRVTEETEMRKLIGNWCRDHSGDRYNIPQEEELADAKRPDLRFLGVGFDAPVPAELKLADKWSGPQLYERLEVQLCGDYLRDRRSSRGLFLLVYGGSKARWEVPDHEEKVGFLSLVAALQNHWKTIGHRFPAVDEIRVVGIDLTKRMNRRPPRKAQSKTVPPQQPRKEAVSGKVR